METSTIPPRQLAPLLRPHLQTLLGVEPVGPLAVGDQPLPPQQRVQPEIAVAAVLRGQLLQAADDRLVVLRRRTVLLHRPRQADNPAAAPLAETQRVHQEAHGSSPGHGLTNVFREGPSSPTIRFSLAFSVSSSRSRFASLASMPPYFFRQVYYRIRLVQFTTHEFGHQWKVVLAAMRSRSCARVRQRSSRTESSASRVSKWRLATGSSTSGQRCSAGCNSGV